jgi:peptidoglycan hydrolase CwlO-like protein
MNEAGLTVKKNTYSAEIEKALKLEENLNNQLRDVQNTVMRLQGAILAIDSIIEDDKKTEKAKDELVTLNADIEKELS